MNFKISLRLRLWLKPISGYLHNQWEKLIGYLEDGRLVMDNNLAENTIRPFVIGRKTGCLATPSKGLKPPPISTPSSKRPKPMVSNPTPTCAESLQNYPRHNLLRKSKLYCRGILKTSSFNPSVQLCGSFCAYFKCITIYIHTNLPITPLTLCNEIRIFIYISFRYTLYLDTALG